MRGKPAIVLAACLALAALSLLLPSVPTTDPWGWIIWGREVAHVSLDTAVGGSPSWKPLPVLLTAPLSLFGDTAPALWLVVARAAGLITLLLAYKVAARAAGAVAGVSAAVLVALSGGWIRAESHGYSEPMLDALMLGAAERHLAGSRRTALVLLALGSLIRPEVFAFAILYALWLVRRDHLPLIPVGAGLLVVPALWLGGDWWGAGNPLHGGDLAKLYSNLSASQMLDGIVPAIGWATIGLAALSIVIAAQLRDRLTLALAGWGIAWVVMVVVLPLFGGPGSTRFLMPPDVLLCVVAGVAVGRMAELPGRPAYRAVAAAAALGLLLVLPQVLDSRTSAFQNSLKAARSRARIQDNLERLARIVSDNRMPVCGVIALPLNLGWNRGVLAWVFRSGLNRITPWPRPRDVSAGAAVRFESPPGEKNIPARPSTGSLPRLPFRAMTLPVPANGGVFFVPVRNARVRVDSGGFDRRYVVRDGDWTVAAICPRKSQPASLRARPAGAAASL